MVDINNLINNSYFGNFPNNQPPQGVVNVRERVGVFQRSYQVNFNSLAEAMAQEAKKILAEAKINANSSAEMAFNEAIKYTDRVITDVVDNKIVQSGKQLTDYINDISGNVYKCFIGLTDNLNKLQEDINQKLINFNNFINEKVLIIEEHNRKITFIENSLNNINNSIKELQEIAKKQTEANEMVKKVMNELGENKDGTQVNRKKDGNLVPKIATIGNIVKREDGTPRRYTVWIRNERFILVDRTNKSGTKEDYDNLVDMRRVVFKKAEVDGNIILEVDRKRQGWDVIKGTRMWKRWLFNNFWANKYISLDKYEYVYFIKANEDQVILERRPCTTKLANSNAEFLVKNGTGFQYISLKKMRQNKNNQKTVASKGVPIKTNNRTYQRGKKNNFFRSNNGYPLQRNNNNVRMRNNYNFRMRNNYNYRMGSNNNYRFGNRKVENNNKRNLVNKSFTSVKGNNSRITKNNNKSFAKEENVRIDMLKNEIDLIDKYKNELVKVLNKNFH